MHNAAKRPPNHGVSPTGNFPDAKARRRVTLDSFDPMFRKIGLILLSITTVSLSGCGGKPDHQRALSIQKVWTLGTAYIHGGRNAGVEGAV